MESLELFVILVESIIETDLDSIGNVMSRLFELFNNSFRFSMRFIICRITYTLFTSKLINYSQSFNIINYFEFNYYSQLFEQFIHFLNTLSTRESYYLLQKISNHFPELIKKNIHFISNIYDKKNSKKIFKILRNDNLEKLQEISTQNNFNFNQKIEPSLYERYSFINNYNVSLIDYCAFFGSINCFKYLLLNGASVQNTLKYAIAGGNLEIIHLCEQNNTLFEDALETAIQFHQNDIFYYYYDKKIEKIKDLTILGTQCIKFYNFKILQFLIFEGLKITDKIINKLARYGNIFLLVLLKKECIFPKNILLSAVKSKNFEIVNLILNNEKININEKYIYFFSLEFF